MPAGESLEGGSLTRQTRLGTGHAAVGLSASLWECSSLGGVGGPTAGPAPFITVVAVLQGKKCEKSPQHHMNDNSGCDGSTSPQFHRSKYNEQR